MRTAPTAVESDAIRRIVFQHAAIVLDANKDYLLLARLTPLLDREGMASWDELVRRLRGGANAPLRQKVVEAMTTHETFFFRDWQPFEALRLNVLPEVAERAAHTRTLNIWSAASSTGQELYSIALILKQQAPRWAGWTLRLIGTDISTEILGRAREARYSQLEVNRGLPAPLLVRYFTKQGTEWALKDEVRQMCEFRAMNLVEAWPPLPLFDVVFLRNVLIYFDVPTKRAILERVSRAKAPGGYLFLGGVETTLNLSDQFVEVPFGKAVCFRRVDR